jgi:hypothetical protein
MACAENASTRAKRLTFIKIPPIIEVKLLRAPSNVKIFGGFSSGQQITPRNDAYDIEKICLFIFATTGSYFVQNAKNDPGGDAAPGKNGDLPYPARDDDVFHD